MTNVNAGFRCDSKVYNEIKSIAMSENRSIANVLNFMVSEQVKRYQEGGFKAMSVFHEVKE